MNTPTLAQEREPFSILITDDDSYCREALREIFEPEGYQTVQASSGEEALDIVREHPVHLVLLDMHMPRLTGLETIRLLHQVRSMLPCILVTGDSSASLLRQACQAQAYSVIHKPISKGVVLYTVVRALLRHYGVKDADQKDREEGGG